MSFLLDQSQLGKLRKGLLPRKRSLAWPFFFLFDVLNRISLEGNLVQDGICGALQKGNLAFFQLLGLSCGLSAWPESSRARSAFSGQNRWSQCRGDEFPFPPQHVSCSYAEQGAPAISFTWMLRYHPAPLIPVFSLSGLWVWRRRGWRVSWQISWLASRSCSCRYLSSGSQSPFSTASSSTSRWPP